jgi:hypothetical protein
MVELISALHASSKNELLQAAWRKQDILLFNVVLNAEVCDATEAL